MKFNLINNLRIQRTVLYYVITLDVDFNVNEKPNFTYFENYFFTSSYVHAFKEVDIDFNLAATIKGNGPSAGISLNPDWEDDTFKVVTTSEFKIDNNIRDFS